MDSFVAPDHPTEDFLFCVLGELHSTIQEKCEELIERLKSACDWSIGPPEFVDELEDPEDVPPGLPPLRTMGGVLKIYRALPPWQLPREVDIRHYREVTTVLEALKEASTREGFEFTIVMRGEEIGDVRNGELDRGLLEGLLNPWREHLGLSEDQS